MRHTIFSFFALVFILMCATARASHIYGADFFYEHISNYTYRVSLVVYGDCKGGAFFNLASSSPTVLLMNNGSTAGTYTLTLTGPGVEVTPVCPAQQNNTTCKDTSFPVPGVTRYTYSQVISLPSPQKSANWVFRFTGAMGGSSAGRSNSISNITIGSSGSIMVLDAALNNVAAPNSSPRFTTLPTPFYCVNVAQQYNQGAVDPNNDSLVYSLAPGLETSGTVSYNVGYSATAPLAATPGTFSFSASTGQMNFTPNMVQKSLVVNKVTEYRNGVVVGTASREMTFIVLPNCNNTPPASKLDTSKAGNANAVPISTSTINVCEGADSSRFTIIPNNPGGDTIYATVNGLPAGATATVLQNGTTFPIISVEWNLPTLGIGSYNFFVTYKDNGCPLSSQQTQAYTVQVIRPNTMTTQVLAPTDCIHQAFVRYNFNFGTVPRTVTISRNGNLVHSYVDNLGTFSDSLAEGSYTVTVGSPNLPCESIFNLTIVDSGIYPHRPGVAPVFYCLGDEPEQLRAAFDSGAILKWYTSWGMQLPNAPTPRTDSAGIFVWYVNQRFKMCESAKDSIMVYVTKRPVASIHAPPSICLNDTASIFFNGSIGVGPILEYFWEWDGAGYKVGSGPGPWLVHWFSAGEKTVRLSVAENKCASGEVEKKILVRPAPYAGFNAFEEVCQFDTMRVSYNTNPFKGQKYAWDFDGADTPFANGPGPYLLRWDTAGPKRISLTIDLDGCVDTRMKDIFVRPAPDARIMNAPGPVCIGDKIYLQATGGDKYYWTPKDSLVFGPDGRMYAQILRPTVYKVLVETTYGCKDSAAITYDRIEPCCNFSYPNAFTPNGDGRNDRFRIITYGNHLRYELSIYNNWGQRVYYGLDAYEGWDGTFRGQLCAAGTYFYYLNATCFTGHQETQKGDLMLVR